MKLSEIHTAIETGRGPALPEDKAFATLVAIEQLAQIEGIPVAALDYAAPKFGASFPLRRKYLRDLSFVQGQYQSWRNLILSAQLRFAPGDVDADPWHSLARAARLWNAREVVRLSDLQMCLPPGTQPQQVTDALLEQVHDETPAQMLRRFRKGLKHFRKLFQNDLALRTGLLPDLCPSPLPGIRDHHLLTGMSPDIEAWRNSLPKAKMVYALNYLNRLAIAGNRLNGKTDTLDDLRLALCDLPDPARVGVPPVNASTLRKYETSVRHALGGPDPGKSPIAKAWADLRTAARAAGYETGFLCAVAEPAAVRGIIPAAMSQTTALEILTTFDVAHKRSKFRRGCEQVDALRGQIPADLLPSCRLGIKRLRPRSPKPVLPPDPVKIAWADLSARLRGHGWTVRQRVLLSYIRVRATRAGIAPSALHQDFISLLESEITTARDRNRLKAAVRSITALSREAEFSDLPALTPPASTKFTHGGAVERVRSELEDLMDFMNAAAGTRRAFRVSVGVLTDAMGRPEIPLKQLLQSDISAYDIGTHEPRRKVHTDRIRKLREFLELPWTPAWRALQRVVADTGMTAQDNPVPKVLAWHPGTDPDGLTLEWAQRLDRELRSRLTHPPHGRAGLAKILARQLAAFDALHDIPEVAQSGLLPARIGAIR